MTIPTRYEDLTVDQFMQLDALKYLDIETIDKSSRRLSILSGSSIEAIDNMSITQLHDELLKAIFLNEPIHMMPLNETIWLGLNKFEAITKITYFTTAQYIDYTAILKANDNNYIKCLPNILAIIHKELTLSGFKYVPENHDKNVELFKYAKLKDVMGSVFFYSKCLKSYSQILATSLEQNTELINELVKEMNEDKGFQDFLNSGVGTIQ